MRNTRGMYEYRVGGRLAVDDPTYIERYADEALYQNLVRGEFCYVLTPRQMGKSSLRSRTHHRLEASGRGRCAAIDLTRIGSQQLTPEQWYLGLAFELYRKFGLPEPTTLQLWWQSLGSLPPVQKLSQFLEDRLLKAYPGESLFIFLDEIDSVQALSFCVDDFFGLVRFCYNQRSESPDYRRLAWTLLGVATPRDLVRDVRQTPFNIGQAIHLTGFSPAEAVPLARGFTKIAQQPHQLLAEVLRWTAGQPFLTQKVCRLLQGYAVKHGIAAGSEAMVVEQVVRSQILENWEAQDDPEHLRTIRDRILADPQRSGRLLGLYQQMLTQDSLKADSSLDQAELKLSGIAIDQGGRLQVANPIYATVFSAPWVSQCLMQQRPYAAALQSWVAANFQDESRLLMGQALQEALQWAADKSLSDLDYRFLSASQEWDAKMIRMELVAQEKANRLLADAQRKAHQIIWLSYLSLATCLIISAIALLVTVLKMTLLK